MTERPRVFDHLEGHSLVDRLKYLAYWLEQRQAISEKDGDEAVMIVHKYLKWLTNV